MIADTGHALAMGAILLFTSDVRIGAEGTFKIGLNEVAIGMPVPLFAVELGRDRLTPTAFTAAINHATVYDPAGAAAAGFLDQVVAPDDVVPHRAGPGRGAGRAPEPEGLRLHPGRLSR